MNDYPIVVQEIIYKKEDFPKTGESFSFAGKLYRVMCSKISLKLKNLYFVNIWLEATSI